MAKDIIEPWGLANFRINKIKDLKGLVYNASSYLFLAELFAIYSSKFKLYSNNQIPTIHYFTVSVLVRKFNVVKEKEMHSHHFVYIFLKKYPFFLSVILVKALCFFLSRFKQ